MCVNWFASQTGLPGGCMENRLLDVEQRVKRYWFQDGIGEIAGGGLFLLIGLYFAGHEWLPPNSVARTLVDSSLAILLIGGVYVTRWLINVLKAHLTYPRTGYVEYHPNPKNSGSHRIWTAITAIGVSMLLVLFGRYVGSFNWLPGFTGLVVSVALLMARARIDGLGRFYFLAALSVISGLGLSVSGLSMRYSFGLFYGLVGAASMASGCLTLLRYLRENPLPVEE